MNAPTNMAMQDMLREIAEVEMEDTRDSGQQYTGFTRWLIEKPLETKAWLVTSLGLVNLLMLMGIALYGFSNPDRTEFARVAICIAGAGALLANVFSVKFLIDKVITPFCGIVDEMERLGQGARDIETTGRDRKDEIGRLARALHSFTKAGHKLDELFGARREIAEQRKKELYTLATSLDAGIGEIAGSVAAASSQLKNTATTMTQTANEASRKASEVIDSMEQASSGATAAAAASDEFAMSIGEISRQASFSAELARRATETASGADDTISALSTSAAQVGQIVELIQSIAQRTNLLALNASIEAARGGEAGRGFAVVASEVKELAAQTSRATEEVAEQIRAMQDSTGASVGAVRSIIDQIRELESTAVSIASAVDQQSVAGQDLARNIDLAARSTGKVSDSITEVRETSLATGAAASQVLSSAEALENQATDLRQRMQSFLTDIRAG